MSGWLQRGSAPLGRQSSSWLARAACGAASICYLSFSTVAAGQTPAAPASAATPAPVEASAQGEAAAPVAEPVPVAEPAVAEAPPRLYEPAPAQFKIETANSSLRIGFLLQPQYEAAESPSLGGLSHNLLVHRARVLLLAQFFGKVDFFFETDFADIFRPNAEGIKSTPGMNIVDAFLSYKVLGEQLRVDAGYMLPPLSRNALQGAVNLYGLDYFSNTFRHSNSFNTSIGPAGRDVGVQLRGQVLNHLEYRLGTFQGVRDPVSPAAPATANWVGADNPVRIAARLQVNVLDPDPFFFYGGSYLGAKHILSFGASYDFQEKYKYWAVDGTLDLPLGDGVLTGQIDLAAWDGGSSIASLPEQKALMGEIGYSFNALRLAPILRAEQRWVEAETAAAPDETRLGGGLAYWLYGHYFNLKAFYTHVSPEPAAHGYNVFQLQAQMFLL